MVIFFFVFFFNDTATTEIYTLSLHDALPISLRWTRGLGVSSLDGAHAAVVAGAGRGSHPAPTHRGRAGACRLTRAASRSEEHTSELQSRQYLVCRLLLEKKKNICISTYIQQ